MFNPPHSQAEIEGRVNEVLAQWHDADVNDWMRRYAETDRERYSQSTQKHFHVAAKYIRLDTGGSGAFMVDIQTGVIYGIKGYGKVNTKKVSGNLWDTDFNGATLSLTRFKHGRFDLRKAAA